MFKIVPLQSTHLSEAAAIFSRNLQQLRRSVPALPDVMENLERIASYLEGFLENSSGIVALDHGRVVGFLGWFLVNEFRRTKRKAAYVPEWAHGANNENQALIYRALYRAAAAEWAAAGCQVHAISLLAHDQAAINTWFWNGFGLLGVDAVRPMLPLTFAQPTQLKIQKATQADSEVVSQLDDEHWQHYPQPPIFMVPKAPSTPEDMHRWLARPKNSVWLAWEGSTPAGFLRLDGYEFDSVAIIDSAEGIFISGAYVRPAYRGQGVATALLDAALQDYQQQGIIFCAVNFESFNPEAAAFWTRYFEPVCLSLMRIPETLPGLFSA